MLIMKGSFELKQSSRFSAPFRLLKTNSMPYEKKNVETPKKKPMIIPVKNAAPAWTKTKVRNIMRDSKYPELHGEMYLG